MAFVNLPWLNDSGQFLNAMIAGGRAGLEREQMAQRERLSDRPRGGRFNAEFIPPGGFPMAPQRIAEPVPQEASVIEEEVLPPNQPFKSFGKTWITNPAGNVVEYVPPVPKLSSPFGSSEAGYFALDPSTGTARQLVPPTPSSAREPSFPIPIMENLMGGPTTIRMTPTQLNQQFDTLPEFGRTNPITQIVRGMGSKTNQPQMNNAFASESDARSAGLKTGDTVYIRGVGLVRLK
jgi:hypothetical protein